MQSFEKLKSACILIIYALLLSSQILNADTRTWTSNDGVSIKAQFVSSDDKEVTIKRVSDNRLFTLPLERLSKEDQQWTKEQKSQDSPEQKEEVEKDALEIIELPLIVHIITDIEFEKKGVKMDMWLTPQEFKDVVLPEINRIWKQAGIVWVLKEIKEKPAARVRNKDEAITYIQNSARDEKGKTYPDRTPFIKEFCNLDKRHSKMNNLYLFPYMGGTFQGFASMGGNYAVNGVWTDKPSGGKRPPQKVKLVEGEPFKIGSLARTCSHELGHNLELHHPDKKTQKHFSRLMGGIKHGYDLLPKEIEQARKAALKRLKLIN